MLSFLLHFINNDLFAVTTSWLHNFIPKRSITDKTNITANRSIAPFSRAPVYDTSTKEWKSSKLISRKKYFLVSPGLLACTGRAREIPLMSPWIWWRHHVTWLEMIPISWTAGMVGRVWATWYRKPSFIHLTSAESVCNSLRRLHVARATKNRVCSVRSPSESLPQSLKWPDWKKDYANRISQSTAYLCKIGRSRLKPLSKSRMMVSPSGNS